MQIVKVTHTAIFSAAFTFPMLAELAGFVGMTVEQVNAASNEKLNKGSKTVQQLEYAKLRTIVAKKLGDSTDYGDAYASGDLELEFTCLPDLPEPDINNAGKNKSTPSGNRSHVIGGKGALKGAYVVVKNGLKCTAEQDPDKFALWQHVWHSSSFEEYFAKAPAKAITRTGRLITASSEIRWALKCGWIQMVTAEQTN